jgi:hypothetical protein
MNENSMKSCMSVVLIPARMPVRSGWHMAAIGASERTWVPTGFDWSQLSQRLMTTGWIWSGCRLLNFCKKTNQLRFWLCPNGVKNRTQLDLKPLLVLGVFWGLCGV